MKKNLRFMLACMLMMLAGTASAAVVTDELTWEGLGLVGTNSNYSDFADKSFTSPAVYAGQASSGSGKYIQLRSKNSNSGIITTTSGGKLVAVTITFNESTTDRKISVYAKNEAYSAATDLYGDNQGTKLGDIAANDASKRLVVDGDYTFIGLRSADGAIYIDKIEIEWESGGQVQTTAAKPTISPNGGTFDESQEVTITAAEGASIFYALNEGDFQAYSAPFTLTETTTVKAYAVDETCDVKQSATVTAVFTKNQPVEVQTVTIAEFNAAEVNDNVWYQLTGTVKNLEDGDQYGNFDIEDETGSVYVYGLLSEKGGAKKKFQELVAAKGIQNGSVLTLIGTRGDHNGTIEVKNAYFVDVDNSGVEPGPGPQPVEFEGDGTQANPYTVADVKAMTEADFPADKVWVKGFIAGSLASNAKFSEEAVATNIALATTANEENASNTVPVQLPSGAVREKLNIVDNPTNKGKEVKVYGNITSYFSTTGVKNVENYEIDGETNGINTVTDAEQQAPIYNLGGQRVMQPTKGLFIVNGKKVVK